MEWAPGSSPGATIEFVAEFVAVSRFGYFRVGAALAAKRGEMKVSALKGASKQMYGSMSEEELEEFASRPRKDLPGKTSQAPLR